jgi:transposase
MVEIVGQVTGGIDTHADTHTVAALDEVGQLLGHATFPATEPGYEELLRWLIGHGPVIAVGIEGTGSYGAGLTRHFRSCGVMVVEVDRPDRRSRRRQGKSDPLDAVAAARAVLAGTAIGVPKARDGVVESIRALRVARRSAIKAHTAAVNGLHAMVISAPEQLRASLQPLTARQLVATAARLRPGADLADPVQGTKRALRRLARRCQELAAEITEADADLKTLITQTAPGLLDRIGVGVEVAGQLLVTAGDNPARLRSDAALAALCGASPIPVSSGRTDRHRLNRGGDRAANCALYWIVITRMSHHQPTKDYVTRRTAQGLTTKEIIRCLKRYLARELLPLLNQALEPERASRCEDPTHIAA